LSIRVEHTLRTIGVVMAGEDIFDPPQGLARREFEDA